jgi:signal transduction histidine kinase
LEQALINLLRNALTYGSGKPIELQRKLFQRFERAVPTKHFGGLGLGLYITKQIIELHGGSIRFESQENQGTTFFIDLPRDPGAPLQPQTSTTVS